MLFGVAEGAHIGDPFVLQMIREQAPPGGYKAWVAVDLFRPMPPRTSPAPWSPEDGLDDAATVERLIRGMAPLVRDAVYLSHAFSMPPNDLYALPGLTEAFGHMGAMARVQVPGTAFSNRGLLLLRDREDAIASVASLRPQASGETPQKADERGAVEQATSLRPQAAGSPPSIVVDNPSWLESGLDGPARALRPPVTLFNPIHVLRHAATDEARRAALVALGPEAADLAPLPAPLQALKAPPSVEWLFEIDPTGRLHSLSRPGAPSTAVLRPSATTVTALLQWQQGLAEFPWEDLAVFLGEPKLAQVPWLRHLQASFQALLQHPEVLADLLDPARTRPLALHWDILTHADASLDAPLLAYVLAALAQIRAAARAQLTREDPALAKQIPWDRLQLPLRLVIPDTVTQPAAALSALGLAPSAFDQILTEADFAALVTTLPGGEVPVPVGDRRWTRQVQARLASPLPVFAFEAPGLSPPQALWAALAWLVTEVAEDGEALVAAHLSVALPTTDFLTVTEAALWARQRADLSRVATARGA